MAAQTVFDQEGRQIATAPSLVQGMTLEIIHHPAGQGDVDPLELAASATSPVLRAGIP